MCHLTNIPRLTMRSGRAFAWTCANLARSSAITATLLLASTGFSYAVPMITFQAGALGNPINIANGNPFPINLMNGSGGDDFTNKTGKVIKDFHFVWKQKVNGAVGADDFKAGGQKTAFGSFTATTTTLDFFDQPGGAGIGVNADFHISLSGFGKNAMVTANATFAGGKGKNKTKPPFGAVPEPMSAALFGPAAIGVLVLTRGGKRHRRCTRIAG